MNKFRACIISMILILCGFVLGACGSTVTAEQIYPLKIWKENRNGQMETWKVVDEDTGVNYIVVAPNFSNNGGQKYDGICITPRLNEDGTLYISR